MEEETGTPASKKVSDGTAASLPSPMTDEILGVAQEEEPGATSNDVEICEDSDPPLEESPIPQEGDTVEASPDGETLVQQQQEPGTDGQILAGPITVTKSLADSLDDDDEEEEEENVKDHDNNEESADSQPPAQVSPEKPSQSPHEKEMEMVGAEIIFPKSRTSQWTNLSWLACDERKVRLVQVCTRLVEHKSLKWFGSPGPSESFPTRKLVVYEKPNLILLLRSPKDVAEVQTILDLPQQQDSALHLQDYLVAETVIDPITCKLRLSPLTTVTSIENSGATKTSMSPHRRACLQLVTPTETVMLSALRPKEDVDKMSNSVGFLETKTMELAVANALYAAHSHSDDDLSWRHQLVLGTLSSFVVSGSQKQLEKALAAALAKQGGGVVPTHVIDDMDESGRTALHYACTRRNSAAVSALISAGANPSIECGEQDELPIHTSARLLDHMSLSTILSAKRRPDPNATDKLGRTAMYMVATEGVGNPTDLAKCLSVLDAWSGTMGCMPQNPVTVVAAGWKFHSLGPLLTHEGFRYPLAKGGGASLAAIYKYPIHAALITFRHKIKLIGEASLDHGFGGLGGDTAKSQIRGTLLVLLEHGFEPNERIDVRSNDDALLADHLGFSPLQILAAAALDAEQLSRSSVKIASSVLASVISTLAGAADVLVQCGARSTLEAPPTERVVMNKEKSTKGDIDKDDRESVFTKHDRSSLKVDGNKDLLDLLGGSERLEACKKVWIEKKYVECPGQQIIHQDPSPADSDAPGGSSDRSCAICWKNFGTLMNRRHTCRVTVKHVCDECSGKRITEHGQEHRVSDGQYVTAMADVARLRATKLEEQKASLQRKRNKVEEDRVKKERKEKTEDSQRDSLFGGMLEKATNLLVGEEDEEDKDKVGGLQASLGQTRDALNERGERLNTLSDKTEKLMSASEDFAKMAKELEKSSNSFW